MVIVPLPLVLLPGCGVHCRTAHRSRHARTAKGTLGPVAGRHWRRHHRIIAEEEKTRRKAAFSPSAESFSAHWLTLTHPRNYRPSSCMSCTSLRSLHVFSALHCHLCCVLVVSLVSVSARPVALLRAPAGRYGMHGQIRPTASFDKTMT